MKIVSLQKKRKTVEIDIMTLLDGCRRNDRLSQNKLFDELMPQMMKICRRYCVDEDEAKDCMIEGFEKMFESIHNFKGKTEQSFRCWVKRIILNWCISKYRRKTLERNIFTPINEDTISIKSDIKPSSRVEYEDLLKVIDGLSDCYREVFKMKEIIGMDYKEISKVTGKCESTIRSQINRGKKELRKMLNTINY